MSISVKTIFDEFIQNVNKLDFYGDIVKKSYEKYLSEIEEHKKKLSNIDSYSSKRPVYLDILNNHNKVISDLKVDKSFDQTKDDIFFHYNKQMQWFLVETYELYEDFLEKLYATMGYLDNNFWNDSDFGAIQLNEIVNKDKNWFFEQIKKKKEKPYSIIKVFEKRFNLSIYYNKNIPETNYQFLMKLISEFRHAIVHDRGFLEKDKLLNKQGINGEELIKKYENFIDFYYDENKYNNLICLNTIIDNVTIKGLPINYDRRLMLSQYILSYANLMTKMSIEYLEKNKKITK